MLTIKDFGRFERRDTLRVRGALPWLALPVDLTSAGLVKLRMRPNGCRAFGLFILLVEYAASRFVGERDGRIKDDFDTLAAILMVRPEDLREDVKSLTVIGWVETDGEHAADMPQECRRSAAEVPQTCGVDRIGLDRIGLDRIDLPLRPLAYDNQPDSRPADKPRVPRKTKPLPPPTGTDDLLPGHIMAAWDARWLRAFGAPYARTSNGKEAANAKRLIAAVQRTGLTLPDIGAAMDRFNMDTFYRGKDLSVFCSHFAEFTTDRRKAPGQAERFGPDDEIWNLANGRHPRNGHGDGVPSGVLPDIWEIVSGNGGGMGRPLLGDEPIDTSGSGAPNGGQ